MSSAAFGWGGAGQKLSPRYGSFETDQSGSMRRASRPHGDPLVHRTVRKQVDVSAVKHSDASKPFYADVTIVQQSPI